MRRGSRAVVAVALAAVSVWSATGSAWAATKHHPKMVRVPSLAALSHRNLEHGSADGGVSPKQMMTAIHRAGLKTRVESSDGFPMGEVDKISPKGGTLVKKGSTVVVFVFDGPLPAPPTTTLPPTTGPTSGPATQEACDNAVDIYSINDSPDPGAIPTYSPIAEAVGTSCANNAAVIKACNLLAKSTSESLQQLYNDVDNAWTYDSPNAAIPSTTTTVPYVPSTQQVCDTAVQAFAAVDSQNPGQAPVDSPQAEAVGTSCTPQEIEVAVTDQPYMSPQQLLSDIETFTN